MKTDIVYSYRTGLSVPLDMGVPSGTQLISTPMDNLIELCGRVCYDSLGAEKSRGSVDYHAHINEVNHGSVQEHANITFDIQVQDLSDEHALFQACLNRPGVYLRGEFLKDSYRLTINVRAIREWHKMNGVFQTADSDRLGWQMQSFARSVAPLAMSDTVTPQLLEKFGNVEVVEPKTPEETWVSVYLAEVSRGLTHELVRHGDWTGISQRSTRYVDESRSNYAWHPLLKKFVDENPDKMSSIHVKYADRLDMELESDARLYDDIVRDMQPWLIGKGIDKFTARKQSRGAARGFLGNALESQLIFSANIVQWNRIFSQRCSPAADAEIQEAMIEVRDKIAKIYPEWVKA